jgi:hypothetical protein
VFYTQSFSKYYKLASWIVGELEGVGLEDCCSSVLVSCYSEKLVAETWGQFGNSEEGERPPLEPVTK